MSVHDDAPISEASQDRFDFVDFSKAASRAIYKINASNGFVVGINGPWGSGKSSAINLIEKDLLKIANAMEDRVYIINFDPWRISGIDDLYSAYFSKFAEGLGSDYNDIGKYASKLGGRLLGGFKRIPDALTKAGTGNAAGAVGEIISPLLVGDSIDTIRNDLIKRLKAEQVKIFSFIDNIDRLPDHDIRLIVSMVKTVADLPGVVHVLVFDEAIVESAFGENKQNTKPSSRYIDKIVQASFDVPSPNGASLASFFYENLIEICPELVGNDNSQTNFLFVSCLRGMMPNIRSAVRLLNSLEFYIEALKGEVNTLDLIALLGLKGGEPEVYNYLKNIRFYLALSGSRDGDPERISKIKSEIDKLIRHSKEHAWNTCGFLFPCLQRQYHQKDLNLNLGGIPCFRRPQDTTARSLRLISTPEFVDAYFNGVPTPAYPSAIWVREFIANRHDVPKMISLLTSAASKLDRSDKPLALYYIQALLDEVEAGNLPGNKKQVLRAVFETTHLFAEIEYPVDRGMPHYGLASIKDLMYLCIMHCEETERTELILSSLSAPVQTCSAVYCLWSASTTQGSFNSEYDYDINVEYNNGYESAPNPTLDNAFFEAVVKLINRIEEVESLWYFKTVLILLALGRVTYYLVHLDAMYSNQKFISRLLDHNMSGSLSGDDKKWKRFINRENMAKISDVDSVRSAVEASLMSLDSDLSLRDRYLLETAGRQFNKPRDHIPSDFIDD